MTQQTSKLKVEIDSTGERAKVRGLAGDLDKLSSAGDRAAQQAAALSSSIKLAGGAIAGLAASVGIGQLVNDVAQLQDINSRIAGLTGDLASSQAFLKQTAQELSAEYVTLAGGYSQLLPLYDAQVVSLTQIQDLTIGLANVQAASGASNQDLKLSIVGLSQVLSAGNVNYEDYKQIVEPLPGLNAKIAASFGLTSGELKTLISSGQLTSEEFGVKAVAAFKKYEGAAVALADNLTQTFNRTKNAYTEVISAFSEPVADVAAQGAESLADALKFVAENADEIEAAVTAAGVAAGAAFTGQAISSLATYGASQVRAAQSVVALRNATVASAQAAVADSRVKIIQAANAQAMAAADLKAAQAKAASIAGFKRLSFVAGELAVAERAAAAATTQLATAQTAAAASAGTLAAAQRAASLTGIATAAAARTGAAALALVGGPAGAATIAAAGLAYYALKQTEAQKAAEDLSDAVDKLSSSFFSSEEAARSAGSAQLEAAQRSIEAFNAEIDQIQKKFTINAIARFFDNRAIDEARDGIREVYEEIDRINALVEKQAALAATVQPYDAQAIADAADVFDLVADRAGKARKLLEKLIPDDAKRAQLDSFAQQLEEALQLGAIDQTQFSRGNAAINEQLAKLGENRDAIRAAERAAREFQQALDVALPEQARAREFNEQVEALEAGFKRGAISATDLAIAVAGLQAEFDKPALEAAREKADRLNEALGQRVSTGFADYVDEIKLLNDALVEAAGNSDLEGKINLALSRIDAEIRADLTVVEGDSVAKVRASLDRQREALNAFHAERQVSAVAAQADLDALQLDAARRQEDIQKQLRDRLLDLSGAGEAVRIDIDFADVTDELDELLQDRQITLADYQQAVEGAAQAHQERLSDIVRSGEATQAQIQAAAFNDRLAGFAQRYEAQLSIAQEFAQTIADVRINQERREANEAQNVAQRDAASYEEALEAFKRSGTEENRIALEQAKKKAQISEAAAKVQFEQQKKASIAGAKLSAGVAIINALATAPWYVGLAQAALAVYKTQDIISGIKSQSYTGSSAGYSTGSSTGASFGSNITANDQPAAQQAAGVNERVVIIAGDFRSEEEAMFQVGRYQRQLVAEGYIDPDLSNPEAFNNLPDRVVRLG